MKSLRASVQGNPVSMRQGNGSLTMWLVNIEPVGAESA